MKEEIVKKLEEVVKELTNDDIKIQLTMPNDSKNGDYSANVAFQLAKKLGKSPLEVAEEIAGRFSLVIARSETTKQSGQEDEIATNSSSSRNDDSHNFLEKVEAVKPGFINFYLSSEALKKNVEGVLSHPEKVGETGKMKGKKIMVEFTDPNPFKQLHIGHVYSNTIGEAICRLLDSQGAEVKRADYFGDVGMHVAKSLFGLEALFKEDSIDMEKLAEKSLDERIAYLGKAYAKGSTLYEENPSTQEEMKLLNKLVYIAAQRMWKEDKGIEPQIDYIKDTQIDEEKLQKVAYLYQTGRKWSLEYFDKVYARLGMQFDGYFPESIAGEKGYKVVTDHIKDRVFIEDQGAIIFPGKDHGLHTRVFINSLGLPTYEAKELGLSIWKHEEFPYDFSIIVTGSEIDEYFKVLLKAMSQVRPELATKTLHIGHGMVKLATGKKMSSRTGQIITAVDVLDEGKALAKQKIAEAKFGKEPVGSKEADEIAEQVGIGAIKYSFLKSSIGKDVPFSFEESVSFEGNAAPYLQYTYTRTQSILTKVKNVILNDSEGSQSRNMGGILKQVEYDMEERDSSAKPQNDNSYLPQEEEQLVERKLVHFPEVVESAAQTYSPNVVCEYLFELSQMFNNFYQKYRIVNAAGEEEKAFRLNLTEAVGIVLKQGLNLLGIQAPEKM